MNFTTDQIEGLGISGHKNIQSVLFKRPTWTKQTAIKWLKKHNFTGVEADIKPNVIRFRQKDPDAMVLKGFHFITKPLYKDIELILGMRNIQLMYESDSSNSDSDSDSEVSNEDEQNIIKSMKNIRKRIKSHSKIHGGNIRIVKHFKKLGKDIKDNLEKPSRILGGSLSSNDLNTLLKASYDVKTPLPEGFVYDKSISSNTSKVFYNPSTKQAVVAHMGTQGVADWGNNAIFALAGKTGYKMTSRYREAQEVQKLAEKKYGKENITTIGHSQGGLQAEILGTRGKETITVNKATRPLSVFEKTAKNQTDVRSSADLVSAFAPFQKKGKKGITIKAETYDPLVEHATDILDRYDGMIGGKIKIGKKFKKLGKDIGHYAPAMLVGGVPAGLSKAKKINKVVVKPTRKYVGRTDGLLSDVVNYGIPAATSALLGTPAGMLGGPVAGVAASALGAKLGTMAADKIAKETMIESRTGEGLRKRISKTIDGSGDLIHIDIASHNAKGRKASNSMKGGYLEQEHPVPHRGYDTTTSVPNFSQTLSSKRIRSANALLNMISDQDLKDVKTMLSSRSIENTLSSKQRKDIEKKLKKDFKENVTKAKKNIKAKGSGIRVKGSQEAKDHMAKIREMRKAKKN